MGSSIACALGLARGAPAYLWIVLTSTDAIDLPAATLAECGARAFVAKDRLVQADLLGLFSPAAG